MTSIRIRVTGRVQGVGYRAWSVRTALRLGLQGWVRNRADGSVELVVKGPQSVLEAFAELCRQGPHYADVAEVMQEDYPHDIAPGFSEQPTL